MSASSPVVWTASANTTVEKVSRCRVILETQHQVGWVIMGKGTTGRSCPITLVYPGRRGFSSFCGDPRYQILSLGALITSTVSGGFYQQWGKRILDLLLAMLGLVVLSPVLLLNALLVRLRLGSPVLFRQMRPGFGGRPFTLLKFRTMRDLRDRQENLLPDNARLSSFGTLLRRLSFDELPELFNVLKGDMSLVGPRPLLLQYLDRYTPAQARRHEVKPGITGWAQVNGRNAIAWEEKFALDIWYVDNRSFWLDLKILAMTAWKVLRREGISARGEATMPEFMGTVPTNKKSENA